MAFENSLVTVDSSSSAVQQKFASLTRTCHLMSSARRTITAGAVLSTNCKSYLLSDKGSSTNPNQ